MRVPFDRTGSPRLRLAGVGIALLTTAVAAPVQAASAQAAPRQAAPRQAAPVLGTAQQAGSVAAVRRYPGEAEVLRARQAVTGVAQQVAQLQAELAAVQGLADAAQTAEGVAAEAYDVAEINLAASRRAVAATVAAADAAQARYRAARNQVGQFAAAAYQGGGWNGALAAMFTAGGPQDLLERTGGLRLVGAQRQDALRRMDGARAVATAARRQADQALLAQRTATGQITEARRQARQGSAATVATMAATNARVEVLLTRLAQLRHTSLTLERQRAEGLRLDHESALRLARLRVRKSPPPNAEPGSPGGGRVTPGDPGRDLPGTPNVGDPPSGGSQEGTAAQGRQAVLWARAQIGLPYRWGGAGPDSYDCSGLTMRAWEPAGVSLPHSAALQYQQVLKISLDQVRPGDLIFWATNPSRASTIHHVAIYAGDGMMIEAPHTGALVRLVEVRRQGMMPYAGRP